VPRQSRNVGDLHARALRNGATMRACLRSMRRQYDGAAAESVSLREGKGASGRAATGRRYPRHVTTGRCESGHMPAEQQVCDDGTALKPLCFGSVMVERKGQRLDEPVWRPRVP
jgi:hypothetical protein